MPYIFAIATLLSLVLADFLMRRRKFPYWKAMMFSVGITWLALLLAWVLYNQP